MRAAFGLVAVLGALAAIVIIMGGRGGTLDQAQNAINEGKKATVQVQDMSGRDEDNRPVTDAGVFEANLSGKGSILVVKLDPASILAVRYGLKRNDSITEIGPLPVKDIVSSDKDAAAYLQDAYARRMPLKIVRDGKSMELTLADRVPTTPGTPGAPGTPPAAPEKSPLEKNIDDITKMGGK